MHLLLQEPEDYLAEFATRKPRRFKTGFRAILFLNRDSFESASCEMALTHSPGH